MKQHATRAGLSLLLVLVSTAIAVADQKSARPAVFNSHTAMLAVYGEYSEQHKGTLIPIKYTGTWEMKNANVLATPIVTAIYREHGVRKGVIAIQRQAIFDGEIVESHAAMAEISVYVFTYNGKEWVFEKGKQKVTEAGTNGNAPDGR